MLKSLVLGPASMDIENKKNTLLIVDDVPANLKILLLYLHDCHYEVMVARNGLDALEKVNYNKPDLILLDIMMPSMDGFETCRRLKADKKMKDIPIIFMTALNDTESKMKGFEVGAVDYITKPFQHEEVLARVSVHLELKNLQYALKQRNISLQQQNEELDAFAHTIAHDLKNPLNAISNLTSLLSDNLANFPIEKAQEMLHIIERSSHDMFNIIKSLLLLASARIEEVQMVPLDMSAIVEKAQQRLIHLINEYQGQIIIQQDNWATAYGYAPWIEEVWVNYISNGLKYGGRPPHLKLGSKSDGNQIRFWVCDNGKGLTEEEQSCLFVPFTRISQVRVEGHGLGLSIVHRVIKKCGGQVGVESQLGQGSTFYFTLPHLLNN